MYIYYILYILMLIGIKIFEILRDKIIIKYNFIIKLYNIRNKYFLNKFTIYYFNQT